MIPVVESNNKIFSQDIEKYKGSYLRGGEEYLIQKYFRGKVLVLGCGAGRVFKPLGEMGFDVTGIDINADMVVAAKADHPDVPVSVMDAAHLAFPDNSFDTVFFPFHGIDYVYPDIYAAVKEAQRVLRPDGVFVFSSHNRFFIKNLHRFFKGNYAEYHGIVTYRTTLLDYFRLKKYFKKVKMVQMISLVKARNWKDIVYKILSFFSKSTYFVCQFKK
jgi:SAM-dependent methyltransferase